MPDDTTLIRYLEENIDDKRLAHSLGTASEAVKLAKIYGADPKKAYVAGLLHDVAKGKCQYGLRKYADQYGIFIDDIEAKNVELIHGKLGAAMVKEQLCIDDEDILSAIRWHTTGRAGMSLLEKVIYLADLIEPGRDFEDIEAIRQIAYQDIDKAMLIALDQVMCFVGSKGFALHTNSLEAYNYFINKEEEN